MKLYLSFFLLGSLVFALSTTAQEINSFAQPSQKYRNVFVEKARCDLSQIEGTIHVYGADMGQNEGDLFREYREITQEGGVFLTDSNAINSKNASEGKLVFLDDAYIDYFKRVFYALTKFNGLLTHKASATELNTIKYYNFENIFQSSALISSALKGMAMDDLKSIDTDWEEFLIPLRLLYEKKLDLISKLNEKNTKLSPSELAANKQNYKDFYLNIYKNYENYNNEKTQKLYSFHLNLLIKSNF
jgi:hypothetical protein